MFWEKETIQNISIKKILKIGGIILILVIMGFNIYQFGYKNWKNKIYQQGYSAGRTEIGGAILQQIIDTGELRLNLPLSDGSTRLIRFVPQLTNEQQATTTE